MSESANGRSGDTPKPASATASPGFGLERLGLLPVYNPLLGGLVILALLAAAIYGATLVRTDAALNDIFRSNTKIYHDYEDLNRRFPTAELDLFIVVEGDIMDPERLEEVRTLHLDMQFAESVAGVMSMFSMRNPPKGAEIAPPIFPADLPQGDAFAAFAETIKTHPLIKGRFLTETEDGKQLAILVATMKAEVVREGGLKKAIGEIRQIADETIQADGLSVSYSGVPVMKLEVIEAGRRDRALFTGLGFIVGLIVCLVYFRHFLIILIANTPPLISVLFGLAVLGYSGIQLNPISNTILPLVMVVTFTDSMHMLFSIRGNLIAGQELKEAVSNAVLKVGPACALTSLTTSLAMLSLTLTNSGMIHDFGLAAAGATLMAFFSVILIAPQLALLLLRNVKFDAPHSAQSQKHDSWLTQICRAIGDMVQAVHPLITYLGIALVIALAVLYMRLEPHYRLSDNVADHGEAATVSKKLDKYLGGIYPLQGMVTWPEGEELFSKDVQDAISAVQTVFEGRDDLTNVLSIVNLKRWLEEPDDESFQHLKDYFGKIPPFMQNRLYNAGERSALISAYSLDLEAKQILKIVEGLQEKLAGVRKAHPNLQITLTGMSVLSAERSTAVITNLNIGLLLAFVVVVAFIGAAFRSMNISLLSVMPNMFALLATGGLIHLFTAGLQYPSIIALTVAFGLAVDDTIHFLNRLRLEGFGSSNVPEAVKGALVRIGPVLALTTVVLVAGLFATVFSAVPPTRIFGTMCMATLVLALIGDIFFLPAILLTAHKLGILKKL